MMNMDLDDNQRELRKYEYSELSQLIRHYSSLRFTILTVFFALMAGVGSLAFGILGFEQTLNAIAVAAVKLGGAFLTLVFIYLDQQIFLYMNRFMKRARELEEILDIDILKQIVERVINRKWPTPIGAGTIHLLVYVPAAALWVISIFITQ